MAPTVSARGESSGSVEVDVLSRLGKFRSFFWAIVAAQLVLGLAAGPAWALDSCGGCGTRTAAWVGPVIIVVVVAFLAVLVGVGRRQSRSKQGAPVAGPEDPALASDLAPDQDR